MSVIVLILAEIQELKYFTKVGRIKSFWEVLIPLLTGTISLTISSYYIMCMCMPHVPILQLPWPATKQFANFSAADSIGGVGTSQHTSLSVMAPLSHGKIFTLACHAKHFQNWHPPFNDHGELLLYTIGPFLIAPP